MIGKLRRKTFVIPLDRDSLTPYNINLCQDIVEKESDLTEFPEVESDSNQLSLWDV